MASIKIAKVSSSLSAKFNWRIKNFSKLDAREGTFSDHFSVGRHKWNLKIYPKGEGKVYDHLSLYLCPVDLKKSVLTEYSITVASQTNPDVRVTDDYKYLFRVGNSRSWGFEKFMPLKELHDRAKGYIVDDTCVIDVDIACKIDDEEEDEEDECDPVCRGGCIVKTSAKSMMKGTKLK